MKDASINSVYLRGSQPGITNIFISRGRVPPPVTLKLRLILLNLAYRSQVSLMMAQNIDIRASRLRIASLPLPESRQNLFFWQMFEKEKNQAIFSGYCRIFSGKKAPFPAYKIYSICNGSQHNCYISHSNSAVIFYQIINNFFYNIIVVSKNIL